MTRGNPGLKPHKRLLVAALLFIAALTGMALWLVHINAPPTVTHRIERGGSLRVGFALEAPYAFYDEQGHLTGEAPEIFRLMAQRMGIEHIDWVRLDFANLLPELQLGRIDAIAAGMFITPERARQAAFTLPTATVRAALIVRQGERQLPQRPLLADLTKTGVALRWSTVHGAAENNLLLQAGVLPAHIATVPQAQRGVRSVVESAADAFAISAVSAWHTVSHNPQWALEVRTLGDAPAGRPAFVFRQDDVALRDTMNTALQAYLGTGEHQSLVQRFGFTSDELPSGTP